MAGRVEWFAVAIAMYAAYALYRVPHLPGVAFAWPVSSCSSCREPELRARATHRPLDQLWQGESDKVGLASRG